MKKMQDMGGFFVAAVTPYDEQGRFSAPALHKLMDKTIAEGAKGFLIGGSSAECPLLTHEERVEGLQAAAQYENREKTKLMASVAAISTDEAIEYAKTAKALGYDAMISTVPYYYKFGMKAISAYYGALREAVDLPLFLYNFPGNTGVELDIADDHIRGMLTDGTIAGVKQTSLNLYQMERIRDLNPELVIYGGFDEVYIGARILGADGAIGSTFNFTLPLFTRIEEASRRRRRFRSARTTSCRRSSPARCSRPSSTSSRRRAWIAAAAESRSRRSPRRRKRTSSAWSGRICKGIPRRAGRLTFVGRPACFCAKCLNLTN